MLLSNVARVNQKVGLIGDANDIIAKWVEHAVDVSDVFDAAGSRYDEVKRDEAATA